MYAFGMNDDGDTTAQVVAAEFATTEPVASDNSFEVVIGEVTSSTVAFTVTAANNDPYFLTIQDKRYVERFGEGKDESWDDMIFDLTFGKTDDQIMNYLFAGSQELTNESINKSINTLHEYQVVIWGFNNGPTTEVYVSEAFQPVEEVVEAEAEVDDLPEEDLPVEEAPVDDLPFFDEEPAPLEEPVLVAEEAPAAEPAPVTVAEKAESVAKPTVNDAMAAQQAWRKDMPGSQVRDIRSAISLNDRIIFINYLFKEDPMAFQESLTKINQMESLDQVVEYVCTDFPEWDLNSEIVYRFMMAVRRKVR
jgi:hypothetical protein